jgi:hypothetical protein
MKFIDRSEELQFFEAPLNVRLYVKFCIPELLQINIFWEGLIRKYHFLLPGRSTNKINNDSVHLFNIRQVRLVSSTLDGFTDCMG